MEEQTVKLVFELTKEEIMTTCFFLEMKLTKEFWQMLIDADIVITNKDIESMGEESKQVIIAISALAIMKTLEKQGN